MLDATAYQTTACLLRRPPVRTMVEPRNWCTLCGHHEAKDTLCPVCLDDRQHASTAVKMASMCRG